MSVIFLYGDKRRLQVASNTLISVIPNYMTSHSIRPLFRLCNKNLKRGKSTIMLTLKLVPLKSSKFTTVYFTGKLLEL